jgi:hypothetical protein
MSCLEELLVLDRSVTTSSSGPDEQEDDHHREIVVQDDDVSKVSSVCKEEVRCYNIMILSKNELRSSSGRIRYRVRSYRRTS